MNHKKKLTNKSFYAALCACLVVIGAVAYVGGKNAAEPKKQKASENVIVAEPTARPLPYNTLTPEKKTAEQKKTQTGVKTENVSDANKDYSKTEKKVGEEKAVASQNISETAGQDLISDVNSDAGFVETDFQRPVEGSIITTFSDGNLVYNKDLDDWRSHDGIDMAADVGSEVKAVYDGVVSEIVNNVNGKSVKIDHQNGYVSVYSNLDAEVNVENGANVKQGDVIGKVGNTTIAEQFMEPHLHFELFENGKYTDPNKFMQ